MAQRQRGQGRFAGLEKVKLYQLDHGDQPALLVQGVACTLFDDENAALAIDAGKHLVPWFASEGVLVDRFDVRLLLDDPPSSVGRSKGSQRRHLSDGSSDADDDDDEGAELLDMERYADLDYSKEHELENPLAAALRSANGKPKRS